MAQQVDVLIVGGGVIGLTCAYTLAKEGRRVALLDKGELGSEASWAGAGIIPPGNPEGTRSPIDRLRALSSQVFGPFSAELAQRTGIDNGYRVCGGIEFLPREHADMAAGWQAEGIAVETLTPAGLRELGVALGASPSHAYYLPGLAQVRNPRHLRALIEACRLLGVCLRPGAAVADWDRQRDRVTAAVLENGERWRAGQFLVAAGAWGEQLLAPLGVRAGIHPVRGQIVLLRLPAPPFRPVLLSGKNYLVPRDDGRVLAGATEEPEAGFGKQTTAAGVGGLIRWALEFVPSLAGAEVERTWAGLRPGSRDGLPCLGPVAGWDNVFVAAGHFRAGIQLSTGTAQVMSECLAGERPAVDLGFFRPDREPLAGFTPAFRS